MRHTGGRLTGLGRWLYPHQPAERIGTQLYILACNSSYGQRKMSYTFEGKCLVWVNCMQRGPLAAHLLSVVKDRVQLFLLLIHTARWTVFNNLLLSLYLFSQQAYSMVRLRIHRRMLWKACFFCCSMGS